MKRKTLYLLCGKSGSGKNYFVDKFSFNPIVSYTTRDIRFGERHGVDHFFVSKRFFNLAHTDKRIAYSYFNNNHYWADIEELQKGKNIYLIDVNGIIDLLLRFKKLSLFKEYNLKVIYLNTPIFQRIKNMRSRKDSWKNIVSRLWHDYFSFKDVEKYADVEIKLPMEK